MPDIDVPIAPDERAKLERYAKLRGISLDEAVNQLLDERLSLEPEPEPEPDTERPHR